jgi:SAM-dependent methyltransferase
MTDTAPHRGHDDARPGHAPAADHHHAPHPGPNDSLHAKDPGTHRARAHADAEAGSEAEILDLDAEVLAGHLAEITGWLPLDGSPRHVLDLGCGTGAGTFALLDRYPGARVTAVDSSPAHLGRLREKADAAGVAGRVRTVLADLDGVWPELEAPDLVWASASMHHTADPDRALRAVRDLLVTGGLFALVELSGFPRFLPAGAPEDRPGVEERAHAASDRHHAHHVPHRGADWGPKLAAAGFDVEGESTVAVHLDGSRTPAVGRYALEGLRRMRGTVGDLLPAEDLAALDRLLDVESPHCIARRDDLAVRTERSVWAARRAR